MYTSCETMCINVIYFVTKNPYARGVECVSEATPTTAIGAGRSTGVNDGHPRGRPRHPRMRLGGRHRVLPNAPHRAHRPLVAARGFAR